MGLGPVDSLLMHKMKSMDLEEVQLFCLFKKKEKVSFRKLKFYL